MSKPTQSAWFACCTVWNRMKPSEQDIVRTYHLIPGNRPFHSSKDVSDYMQRYAESQSVQVDYVWGVIVSSWKQWAVARGLIDTESEGM